jgi:hypothetical protein
MTTVLGSGFRWNDNGFWVLAFAGMTTFWGSGFRRNDNGFWFWLSPE